MRVPIFLTILLLTTPANAYDYTCDVFLQWHVDERSGTSNVSLTVDDASSRTDAEGKALYRAQARVRSMFSDAQGRRLTFSAYTVVCR